MPDSGTTQITALVGALSGAVGMVLGIVNTFLYVRRSRIRLKVIPMYIVPIGEGVDTSVNFGIEVVNLSEFAVIITDVGFKLVGGPTASLGTVLRVEEPMRLPCRLESRSSYSVRFRAHKNLVNWRDVKCVYARTQCGSTITGTSPALRQVVGGA